MFNQNPANIGLLDFLSLLTNSPHPSAAINNHHNSFVTNSAVPGSVNGNLSFAPSITSANNIDTYFEQTLSEPNSSTSHHQNNNNQESNSTGSASGANSSSPKDTHFKPYVKEIRFEEQTFSSISCKYCRRNHRKCTRNLPSCSNCSKRGIKCEYERKTGGKTISDPGHISIQNPSINDTANSIHVNKKNIIGFYTLQSRLYEIIPKGLFGHLIENLDEAGNDFKAVIFSLQAWRELRLGSKEYSEICFQHAKLLLAPYMDCFTNSYAGMALMNLAFVCQGRRKYKEQSMYLSIVRYFVNEVIEYESRNNTITPDMKNLIKWDTNLRSGLEFLLAAEKNGPASIVQNFPNVIKTCMGFDIRNIGFLEMSMDKTKIDDVFNVLEAILRPFTQKQLCPAHDPQHPSTQLTSTFIDILHNGLKLALMVTVDNTQIDEIWTLSTLITKSAKSPFFPYLPLFVVPFVDLAISEHARLAPIYLKTSVDIEKAIILMEDMEVISSLNTKLERIDDYYQNLQRKVQNSLQHSTMK